MTDRKSLAGEFVLLNVGEASARAAVLRRAEGDRAPILFMHGFGSTKEDYSDVAMMPAFEGRPVIAYDAPGFGGSRWLKPTGCSIQELTSVLVAIVAHYRLPSFHLVGHSMGALAGLLFAQSRGASLRSFVNIEGNLGPEDCFLSRQIYELAFEDGDDFVRQLANRVASSATYSSALYALSLPTKVQGAAVEPLFKSMVDLSDHAPLLESFLNLDCARMYVYGETNRSLSHIGALKRKGISVAEIPFSGHFPMYSNPPAMWACIATFIDGVDREWGHV